MVHLCQICGTSFARKGNLMRHQRTQHGQATYNCSICNHAFKREDNLKTHMTICKPDKFVCKQCATQFASRVELNNHSVIHNNLKRKTEGATHEPSVKHARQIKNYHCPTCGDQFPTRKQLFEHVSREHPKSDLWQQQEWKSPYPWDNVDVSIKTETQQTMLDNRDFILAKHKINNTVSQLNFPIKDSQNPLSEIETALNQTLDLNQGQAFKFNMALGYILLHTETQRMRYFVPHTNSTLLEEPVRIDRPEDIHKLCKDLTDDMLYNNVLIQRPSTKWKPVLISNLNVFVYHLGISMGSVDCLPDFIKTSKSIVRLEKERHKGKLYKDNLCAFRALAYHLNLKEGKNGYYQLEARVEKLYQTWGRTDGLEISEVPEFERVFDIGIDIFSLTEDGSVIPRYLSNGSYTNKATFNLYNQHISYVSNVSAYLKKYKCSSCQRHFKQLCDLQRHRGSCTRATKLQFTGGFHNTPSSVFKQLQEYGIDVPETEQFYPWFAVFDCEAMLIPCDEIHDGKSKWTHRHQPISVSICSNVEGYTEPYFIVSPDVDELLSKMVKYLHQIAYATDIEAHQKWHYVYEQLDDLIEKWSVEDNMDEMQCIVHDQYDDDDDDDDDDSQKRSNPKHQTLTRLNKIKEQFELYCSQLPILGYNSSSYDLNLLKSHLSKHLDLTDRKHSHVIKKCNSYTSISTQKLKFLDILNFLSPGCSYSQFLKAYNVPMQKSFFPYEWFDAIEKLEYPELPPYESFYSDLKGHNVLDENGDEKTGRQRHSELQMTWKKEGMTTFGHYLRYYNNLDVVPFVLGVKEFQTFYHEKNIDVFKIAISVPGIARHCLFKTAKESGATFSLFDQQDDDLYYTFKQNIVGGPSIIFTRDHEVGRTFVRGNSDKPCGVLEGYDANALYLWAFDQPMPTGSYVRRIGPHFNADPRTRHEMMFTWMDFLQNMENIKILHQRNHREVRVGPYLVDGYDPVTNTVYEYNGCWYHGHSCVKRTPENTSRLKSSYERTQKRMLFIESQGYTLITMWECDFLQQLKDNANLKQFHENRLPNFYRKNRRGSTPTNLLKAVENDELFGMLEVDIHVPDHLCKIYEEMSPLFCTTDVAFKDFGLTMQNHVIEHTLSEKPRRLLVGGMRASKILFSSLLLQWYLAHGLVVTHIYQVIEYTASRCFRNFVRGVSDARRDGDTNPDKSIIANTMKLIGNAGYGSLIMDKTRHQNVMYVKGEGDAQIKINDPRFRSCSVISDDLYEIASAKPKIQLNLPFQLGYHILQLAKLRMLQFYYDFLTANCDVRAFEMIEMDTDSAYLAIAGQTLQDIMHPQRAIIHTEHVLNRCCDNEYNADIHTFFPRKCCDKHIKYDLRTPGLFKLEASGDAMVALSSKTYILRQSNGKVKISCKGLNKEALTEPYEVYKTVLATQQPSAGINKGFRALNNTIYTYQQERTAISYFYCKREVQPDGVHTKPLSVTLSPWPPRSIEIVDKDHLLSPHAVWSFIPTIDGHSYKCLMDVCEYAYTKQDCDDIVLNVIQQIREHFDIDNCIPLVFAGKDYYWTCGLRGRSVALIDPSKYPGQNKLGVLWKRVIDEEIV